MTSSPFGPNERSWLFGRAFVLACAFFSHPIPRDLRFMGLKVPAERADLAFVVSEGLALVIFALATFYADLIPGMKAVFGYARARRAEGIRSRLRFATILVAAYLVVLTFLGAIVDATAESPFHADVAIGYFVLERLAAIISFLIIIEADDDDPPARRRRIGETLRRLLTVPGRRAPIPAPVAARRFASRTFDPRAA